MYYSLSQLIDLEIQFQESVGDQLARFPQKQKDFGAHVQTVVTTPVNMTQRSSVVEKSCCTFYAAISHIRGTECLHILLGWDLCSKCKSLNDPS